jgi:hypothetical protein
MATLSSTTRSTTITLASTTAGPFDVGYRIFGTNLRVYINGPAHDGVLRRCGVLGMASRTALRSR